MLPILLVPQLAFGYTELLSSVGVFPREGPQNVQPIVGVQGPEGLQHVWLTDPRGEVVACEKVLNLAGNDSWVRLIPEAPLAPGRYTLHTPSPYSEELEVTPGLDHQAPQGTTHFQAEQRPQNHATLSATPLGAWASDESPVALQLQLAYQDGPSPDPERVDAMSHWGRVGTNDYGAGSPDQVRLRWVDAAGNVTSWTEPIPILWNPSNQRARVLRQLKAAGVASFSLFLGLLGVALTTTRAKGLHRSPVGLRRPISPGPRSLP